MTDDTQMIVESTSFDVGTVVTGKVVRIENNNVYVEFGGKSEGVITLPEVSPLKLTDATQVLHVGQEVLAVLTGYDASDIAQLSRRQAGSRMWEILADKHRDDETFEIVVHDIVNGGLVTDVGVRGFIPASLIDVHRVDDLNRFKGETLPVKIVEMNPGANKLILSRKAVIQEQEKNAGLRKLGTFHEGDVVKGTVRRLVDFGAFVDVGGVEGLVHVSEISWTRIKNPREALREGQSVEVRILKVDPENHKLSLSIRQAESNPWTNVVKTLKEGDLVTGEITRVTDFGAFVEVESGVEGLVHISELSNQRVNRPSDVVQAGQTVHVRVLSVDVKNKRLSLSMKTADDHAAPPSEVKRYMETDKGQAGTGATIGDLFADVLKKLQD